MKKVEERKPYSDLCDEHYVIEKYVGVGYWKRLKGKYYNVKEAEFARNLKEVGRLFTTTFHFVGDYRVTKIMEYR